MSNCSDTNDTVLNCRAEMGGKAVYHLEMSNKKGEPQWLRKAHSHAFAGVLEAIQILNRHFPSRPQSPSDGSETTKTGNSGISPYPLSGDQ